MSVLWQTSLTISKLFLKLFIWFLTWCCLSSTTSTFFDIAFKRITRTHSPWCQPVAGAKDPPLSVVRKFVHLLEQSALDLQEEQHVTQLREEVVTSIRSNQQMEKDLNLMDIKIGLLVKNRISLQVRHSPFSPN